MNERIRELAEQAGYKPLSPSTFADELNEIFMRKFAELIMEECISACGTDQLGKTASAEELIKQHFGVE